MFGTHGSLRTMHGGDSAPSCSAFTHRGAFEEWSGPRLLLKSGPGNRGLEWVAYPFSSRSSPTQESNQGLQHYRWILYQLSYQGSPIYTLTHFKIYTRKTGAMDCLHMQSTGQPGSEKKRDVTRWPRLSFWGPFQPSPMCHCQDRTIGAK